jgi:hypothetical protein
MYAKVGDRVRLTGPMVNSNSTWKPVEDGMPVGLLGTVVHVNDEGPAEWHQISVKWDNGRSLALLPQVDRCFEVLPSETQHAV